MRVAVCGSGNPLFYIAQSILSKGYELTLICPEPAVCDRLAREFKATVICGDPTRKSTLEDAALEKNQEVVALLGDDASNYLVCQLAARIFGMTRTVMLVNNPANEPFFKRLGIQVTFNLANLIGNLVEESLYEEVSQLQSLEGGRILLTVILLNERSPLVGKTFQQIAAIPETKVAAVIRNGRLVAEEESIRPGDKLVTLSNPENQGNAIRKYLGEK